MKTKDNILIIGRPKTGKSCLKGQLSTRLSEIDSKVKVYKEATNIEAVRQIVISQTLGVNPIRTSKDKDIDALTTFHLEFEGGLRGDLIWPDYAGEKITDIIKFRKLPKTWLPLVQESSVWMLFIRLDKLKPIDNLLSRPQENVKCKEEGNKDDDEFKYEISDYAFFVELLQILLFHRGLSTLNKIQSPALQVVLTFWDEFDNDENNPNVGTPKEELIKRCPMLVEFIDSLWEDSKVSYMGLSPQEMALAKNTEEAVKSEKIQDFADAPEDFGYVITDEGKKENDLTFLVHHAVKLGK